jgi:hypothetical protein
MSEPESFRPHHLAAAPSTLSAGFRHHRDGTTATNASVRNPEDSTRTCIPGLEPGSSVGSAKLTVVTFVIKV